MFSLDAFKIKIFSLLISEYYLYRDKTIDLTLCVCVYACVRVCMCFCVGGGISVQTSGSPKCRFTTCSSYWCGNYSLHAKFKFQSQILVIRLLIRYLQSQGSCCVSSGIAIIRITSLFSFDPHRIFKRSPSAMKI